MNETKIEKRKNDSIGVVETQYYTFAEHGKGYKLQSGETLGPITLAYETYGNRYFIIFSNVIRGCKELSVARMIGHITLSGTKGNCKSLGEFIGFERYFYFNEQIDFLLYNNGYNIRKQVNNN